MIRDPIELLSAFVDGEDVAPEDLAEALGAPGAREALSGFLRLRVLVRDDDARPSSAFYERMDEVLEAPARPPWWRRRIRVPAPALALAAAAFVVAAAVLGWTGLARSRGPVPPTPTRILVLVDDSGESETEPAAEARAEMVSEPEPNGGKEG